MNKLKLQKWFSKNYGRICQDIKTREDFQDEESYLMYLATSPAFGATTKKKAEDKLLSEYPNGLCSSYLKDKEHKKKIYILRFRYKNMKEFTPITTRDICHFDMVRFQATVSYKVIDFNGNEILSVRYRNIICEFNNTSLPSNPPKEISQEPKEINPLSWLTYDDLSEDVKKEILIKKLKEIIAIELKPHGSKWSSWEEIPIEIKTN